MAKKRKIKFELSLKYFKTVMSDSCYLCGESYKPVGVDRVNNAKGYTEDNSKPMCRMCNIMKSNHPEKDFYKHLVKIIKYQPKLMRAVIG